MRASAKRTYTQAPTHTRTHTRARLGVVYIGGLKNKVTECEYGVQAMQQLNSEKFKIRKCTSIHLCREI